MRTDVRTNGQEFRIMRICGSNCKCGYEVFLRIRMCSNETNSVINVDGQERGGGKEKLTVGHKYIVTKY